nr:hypothetical protein [Tanacetum cinerariifolium]
MEIPFKVLASTGGGRAKGPQPRSGDREDPTESSSPTSLLLARAPQTPRATRLVYVIQDVKKVAKVDADLAQFKDEAAANQEHNKQIVEETRQRLDDIKKVIDRNTAEFAELKLLLKASQPPTTDAVPPPLNCGFPAQTSPNPGFATQPVLTSSYTAYAPPTSAIVFPTTPLVNPTAPPSAAYTSFLGLRFDSQGFPIPPWETYGNYHQDHSLVSRDTGGNTRGDVYQGLETRIKDRGKSSNSRLGSRPGGEVPWPTASYVEDPNSKLVAVAAGEPSFKRMSEAEFADKKAKGLCFRCDGKLTLALCVAIVTVNPAAIQAPRILKIDPAMNSRKILAKRKKQKPAEVYTITNMWVAGVPLKRLAFAPIPVPRAVAAVKARPELSMSSHNAQSAVTYTSISSNSDGPSWGIPLMNADELPEMDPYEEVEDDDEDPEEDPSEEHEPEDDDEDPEEDPSEEHEPEDDDEDPEEDPNVKHEPEDEDTKEPSKGSDETEPFKEDEIAVTPPPPRHRRARISVRPQTPMAASTQALIDAFASESSSFLLPPTSSAYDQA